MAMTKDNDNDNDNDNDKDGGKILDFMRRNQPRGEGGEALWTAPTKREGIAK
jgi:hypothetical protein